MLLCSLLDGARIVYLRIGVGRLENGGKGTSPEVRDVLVNVQVGVHLVEDVGRLDVVVEHAGLVQVVAGGGQLLQQLTRHGVTVFRDEVRKDAID